MNLIIRFLQRFHSVILFTLLFTAAIVMYVKTSYYQKAQFGRFATKIGGSLDQQFTTIGKYVRLKEQNIALRNENIELKNQIEAYKNALIENKITTTTDSLPDKIYTYKSAQVVKNQTSLQQNFITLNVGLKNGVKQGMGVVCANGIVGIVAATSKNYSSVISLLNTSIKISAKHKKTGAFGSLTWKGINYQRVSLTDIPLHINLQVGDTIVTSGYSAIFPENIPIGSIAKIETDEGNVYNLDIKLFVDFKLLNNVYVVNSKHHTERTQIDQTQI